MAGHEGGVVAFGKDLRSAFAQLTKERKKEEVRSKKEEVGRKGRIKKAELRSRKPNKAE